MMSLPDRLRRRVDELGHEATQAFSSIDRRLGGMPLLLKRTLDCYNAHDGTFISAAMAYYFFFSLFPLILALISVGSLFLEAERAKAAAVRFIGQVLPALEDTISRNIDLVLAQRGTISIVAAFGFIYAASGLFGVLLTVVNRAWGNPTGRSSLAQRVLALVLVLLLAAVFFLSVLVTTLFQTLGQASDMVVGGISLSTLYSVLSFLVSFALTTGVFLLLYWKLPATRVAFADAWPAALAAGITWEAARRLFGWYLSRFTQYTLVYGSFAAIIGLLTWLYLTGYIILLGAELSAQIAERRGRGPSACS